MTALPKLDSKPAERRRHQRVKVVLLGRYMLADRHEYPCQSIDISPGGVALIAPVAGEVGERVVCYIDQIGRVEGAIARVFDNGFAIGINVPVNKREKLADQLTWLANRHSLGMPEDRRHERIVPRITRVTATMPDGTTQGAKIIDVSLSGVALLLERRPDLGSGITIGKTAGRVVRVFGNGVGIEFSRPIPLEQFGDDVVL